MSRNLYRDDETSSSDDDSSETSNQTKAANALGIIKRRRGRPRGNQKPLNAEQRRMRNAELERLRRHEIGEAYKELHDVVANITLSDDDEENNVELSRMQLIQKTIEFIRNHGPTIEEIREQNKKLEEMIHELKEENKVSCKIKVKQY